MKTLSVIKELMKIFLKHGNIDVCIETIGPSFLEEYPGEVSSGLQSVKKINVCTIHDGFEFLKKAMNMKTKKVIEIKSY